MAGVATAITPMAFYETVMAKGYETLVDSGTKVDVNTGMIAAGRLQALIDSRAGQTSMAEILYKMNRIINAIPRCLRSCGRRSCARSMDDTPADEIDDGDDAEDEYDFVAPGADEDTAGLSALAPGNSTVGAQKG